MYKLLITQRAKIKLKKISTVYKNAVLQTLEEIQDDPFIGKPLTRELTGKFSYRVGVFRIIYKINKKDRKIYTHLTQVYRPIGRKS